MILIKWSHKLLALFAGGEDDLLQGINSYRQSLSLSVLTQNKKAGCLANEIAEKLENEPCSSTKASNPVQLGDYPDQLAKCGVDINHTKDAVALPACVPKLVTTLLLTNYTRTGYARYLNNSRFTEAGLGSEDDWMVVVLTTNAPEGDFAAANSLVSKVNFGHCLMSLVLGIFVYLVY